MTKTTYAHLADLQPLVGSELALSDWVAVDQGRIDLFAEATGDAQWIHVDPGRAAAGPFGATIAHGFLTLSLITMLADESFAIGNVRMTINYGLNRVRFPTPVKSGGRVRVRLRLQSYEPVDGGAQIVVEATIELDGSTKPACIAEMVTRRFV